MTKKTIDGPWLVGAGITAFEYEVADLVRSHGFWTGRVKDLGECAAMRYPGEYLGQSVMVEFHRSEDAEGFAYATGHRRVGAVFVEVGPRKRKPPCPKCEFDLCTRGEDVIVCGRCGYAWGRQ